MKMLDEGDSIVKQGFLKKIKTMKKKFFVLYRDSRSGPARLEYYDTEKKFREKKSGQTARRAIMLRSCFAISDTSDSRQKHGIALYTKDDCFGIGFSDEQERDDWLSAMHDLVGGCRGDSRTPMFEHVWDVNVPPKDLGKSFSGPYRLCLTVRHISLVKKASVEPDITFPLEVVRRCGHSGNFFFIEVGRQSSTGEGELWMEAEDALIAQNMHYAILLAMNSSKDYEDLPPRIAPQQTAAVIGGSVPQRSNSHSMDSRQSFIQSRFGGGSAAGYDAAAARGGPGGGTMRPQRSYTFSEPKRSAAAAQAASRGLSSFLMSVKQGSSRRPGAAASLAGGAAGGGSGSIGGGYLGQDLLDRSGSSFYPRMRSDSISSRATSSSLSIDECDQGLASRSLTPDLQMPATTVGLQQTCGGAEPAVSALASSDRRSPNFGGSVLSVHSSRGHHHGPAFDCQKTNTSSSASSLSGSSLDDPYLDMTPAPLSARSAGAGYASYVAMTPCSTSSRAGVANSNGGTGHIVCCDAYASMMPASAVAKHQEGYVEMCPVTAAPSGSSDVGRGSGAGARLVRPDTVRSYLRDAGSDEPAERGALSRRASASGQLPAAASAVAAAISVPAAAASVANCNPYVEMSCSSVGSKLQLPSSAAASAPASSSSGQGGIISAASTPRSLPAMAGSAVASLTDSASSSPRGAGFSASPWHERAASDSTASLHDGLVNAGGSVTARSNPQSPRIGTPDLWPSQPHAAAANAVGSSQQLQQQADLFMEMDFDRPRTASDTFSNRPRTHSFTAAAAHRPRSSSHGQSSKRPNGGGGWGGAAAASGAVVGGQLLLTSPPPSVGAASSAGSSRESTSSSLLGSSNYLDMGAVYGGRADYMDMAFDDRKSQSKSRHPPRLQNHHHRGAGSSIVSQLTVTVPPPCRTGTAVSSRSSSSLECLEVASAAAAPLSPGDYVGIDFSKGFELRVDKTAPATDNAAISPILLRSNGSQPEQQRGCGWDMSEPFPELSGSSSGEDVSSVRPSVRQQPSSRPSPASSLSHSRSNSCSLSKTSSSSSLARRAPCAAAAAGDQLTPQQQARANAQRSSPPASVSAQQRSGSAAVDSATSRVSTPREVAGVALVVEQVRSPADADSYEEMGPRDPRTGFGLSATAALLSSSMAPVGSPCGNCGVGGCATANTIMTGSSPGGGVMPVDCSTASHTKGGDAFGLCAPKKGISYIRQTSRESCSCVPRPAVCYIRPESQHEDGGESSSSSSCGSDEDDAMHAVDERLDGHRGGVAAPASSAAVQCNGCASGPATATVDEAGRATDRGCCASVPARGCDSADCLTRAIVAVSITESVIAEPPDGNDLTDPFALSKHS